MSIKVEGLAKFSRNLDSILDAALSGAARGMNQWAETTMTESKENWVPVDQGELRSTGIVGEPEIQGSNVSLEMGYGGPAAPYALKQHEDLDLKHGDGRRAKYLEGPVLERAKHLQDDVSDEVRRSIERAVK